MSEFVECQNCGRTFFAENIECPYCHGGEVDHHSDAAHETGSGGMFGLLFGGFMLVLGGIAVWSLAALRSAPDGSARAHLIMEGAMACVTLAGLWRRRRWGRRLAILFILGNTALGVTALVLRGRTGSLAWGPGPIAFLLFLLPFFSPQARERFSR